MNNGTPLGTFVTEKNSIKIMGSYWYWTQSWVWVL
jgi:hypothetical protein